MVFVVVLLAGKQLIGIIDVVEIQVQGRCRWMLKIGGILPLLAVDRVVAGYLAGGVLVCQRRLDDMVPALGDVPFPLPADAEGDFFVQRHRNGIAADQDGEYDRPFVFCCRKRYADIYLPCCFMACTASPIASGKVSRLYSSQNLTVALFGFCFGLSMRIRLGSNEASPAEMASPISKIGNKSAKFPILSGSKFLITD